MPPSHKSCSLGLPGVQPAASSSHRMSRQQQRPCAPAALQCHPSCCGMHTLCTGSSKQAVAPLWSSSCTQYTEYLGPGHHAIDPPAPGVAHAEALLPAAVWHHAGALPLWREDRCCSRQSTVSRVAASDQSPAVPRNSCQVAADAMQQPGLLMWLALVGNAKAVHPSHRQCSLLGSLGCCVLPLHQQQGWSARVQ